MISFSGLRNALEKFEDNGEYAKCGKWSIAKGGYDLWWEIYYEGYTVLQCIAGKLEGGFRPMDFTEETEKELIKRVKSIYTDLSDNDVSDEKLEMKTYKCTISITDGEQIEEQEFFVEAESFEDAVEMIKSDLDIQSLNNDFI